MLEDRQILAKSVAEQLGISREWVGSIIHKDLDMRKLSAKWDPKCLNMEEKHQWCQSSEQLFKFFWAWSKWFPVVIGDHGWNLVISLWPADKASNNQWSGGIVAHHTPRNSECKNPLEEFSSWFFGIKMASSSLIIFQRAKLSMQGITYLCWCNWRTFWSKNAAGRSPRGSCSCKTMSRLTWHLQPRRNWPTWASSVLITHPILWIWPRWTTTCSVDWKSNWKVAIFFPVRRSLLPRRPGWTVNLLNFFDWLAKLRAMG